ncbi:MAG: malonyl-CoA synthase [Alphaproteobacteria bacterium]|nr:malonyl-CoA synthase [Alphaproteobacteria bacterium]
MAEEADSNTLFSNIRAAVTNPDHPFILSDAATVTYGGMLERSAQYAHALIDAGVAPGDRVTVQAAKTVECLLFYLAVVRAGAVYQPLNTAYTMAEVEYFITDAEPALVIVDADQVSTMQILCDRLGTARVMTLDAGHAASVTDVADGFSTRFEDVARDNDDLASILYTSGTTGRSKGAMLSHGNLLSNAVALQTIWRFTADDVLIHALPIFHTHGLFVATNVVLLAGATLRFFPAFDPDKVIDAMPDSTVLMGVPTFYTRLLANPRLDRSNAGAMRLFISGSAPLLAETHRAFSERTGQAILERYGMTETNMNTSNPYEGARKPGTVGFPLPGTEVRVTGEQSKDVLAAGEVGMVEVRGPNVFKGYWRMPEKTREEFRTDGFFITGDLGMIDSDGYLVIVGRGKDLIITGGLNVYPKEIEAVIDDMNGVVESAVVGVPHDDFGEGIVAVVVREANADLEAETVRQHLAGSLAKFKVPKAVHFVDALPRNTMGKVQKNELRNRYDGEFKSGMDQPPAEQVPS